MSENNGYEYASVAPGWIKKKVPDDYADDILKEIILFYVINTPCIDLSSSGISLSTYGWSTNVWQKGKLKTVLFKIAGLEREKNLSKDFHKNRNEERIAIYKGSYNEFLSICYHIRNAFAHGRLAMYDYEKGKDVVFVLEDGLKKGDKFQVRSRMILKKSTLKQWMDIIKSGKLPSEFD